MKINGYVIPKELANYLIIQTPDQFYRGIIEISGIEFSERFANLYSECVRAIVSKKDIQKHKPGTGLPNTIYIMESVIKYQINEIVESQGYDSKTGKIVPQKEAKMQVVYTSDPDDPYYVYGCLSSGSTQNLKTINPDVYNTWKVGGIVECKMTVVAG